MTSNEMSKVFPHRFSGQVNNSVLQLPMNFLSSKSPNLPVLIYIPEVMNQTLISSINYYCNWSNENILDLPTRILSGICMSSQKSKKIVCTCITELRN